MTSRERVYRLLEFDLPTGERPPRQLWFLPWVDLHFPGVRASINREFPDDIVNAPALLKAPVPGRTKGGFYDVGLYIDEWGCQFENCEAGIIGEVKKPIVEDWADTSKVRFPEDALTLDVDGINAFCKESECFIMAGAIQRPFERLQFMRGSENLYMDLAMDDPDLSVFIGKLHAYYMKELDAWCQTDVDGLFFMDDWGSQKSLLIHPDMWRRTFKPLYRKNPSLGEKACNPSISPREPVAA